MYEPTNHNKIVILGCGLSGMITALSFAKLRVHSTIIEAKSTSDDAFLEDMRTTAITSTSKKFLNDIGVWPALNEISGKILDIYVADNKAPEMLHFSSQRAEKEAMGYILKNTDFKSRLLDKVKGNGFITLKDKCAYTHFESTDDQFILHLEDSNIIKCDLLIICEGHNSRIKKFYFTREMQKYYNQTALTFNVVHDKPHNGTAVEHFMSSGPFAILPLKDLNSSGVVWTLPTAECEVVKSLPLPEFEYQVQQHFGDFLGKLRIDSKIGVYPLKAYHTHNYFHQRIVLIADSAHIIHPLAGQGLNMGIKDIEVLTNLIHNNGISDSTLKKYQTQRRTDNKNMYLITDNLNRVFSNYSKVLWRMRRIGIKAIEEFAPLKSALVRYAMGRRHIRK
jgi:2-octaprenyl-6-methoxyphenol hydroxylase